LNPGYKKRAGGSKKKERGHKKIERKEGNPIRPATGDLLALSRGVKEKKNHEL